MTIFTNKNRLLFFTVLLFLSHTVSAISQEHYSTVKGYSPLPFGPIYTSFNTGGLGIGFVEDELSINDITATGTFHNVIVRANSSANLGTTGGLLAYTIEVPVDPSAVGSAGTVDNQFRDVFHIEPNDNYPEGSSVPIRFFAKLDGSVLLFGRPSGGSYVGFHISYTYYSESGYTIKTFQYSLPSEYQYPPVDVVIHEEWEEIDLVQVGTSIRMDVNFSMDLNGSGHDTGAIVTNYLDFFDSLNAGVIADGEGVEMWSDAEVDDDIDEDGFTVDVDCDEYNIEINPEAKEVCYDGKDNDCDSLTDLADKDCKMIPVSIFLLLND